MTPALGVLFVVVWGITALGCWALYRIEFPKASSDTNGKDD